MNFSHVTGIAKAIPVFLFGEESGDCGDFIFLFQSSKGDFCEFGGGVKLNCG